MKKSIAIAICIILLSVVTRLLPHLNNFSPMIALSLMVGAFYSRQAALGIILVSMVLSDMAIGLLMGYPLLGLWGIFTYSGMAAAVLLGSQIPQLSSNKLVGILAVLGSGLGFWVWTNFGVWLMSSMYLPHTWLSFETCFIRGIPFLQHQLLGSLAWMLAFYGLLAMQRDSQTSSQVVVR